MIDETFIPRMSNNMDEIIIATGNYDKLVKSTDALFDYVSNPELNKDFFDLILKNMFISGYMASLMLICSNIKNHVKENCDNVEAGELVAYIKLGKIVTEMLNDIDK
jgi:hypothetical protein